MLLENLEKLLVKNKCNWYAKWEVKWDDIKESIEKAKQVKRREDIKNVNKEQMKQIEKSCKQQVDINPFTNNHLEWTKK